jgi:hypothetical protein
LDAIQGSRRTTRAVYSNELTCVCVCVCVCVCARASALCGTLLQMKEQFGCDNWPNAGAELEDYGSSGTAGSHWEKRTLMNEFMTGTADLTSVCVSCFVPPSPPPPSLLRSPPRVCCIPCGSLSPHGWSSPSQMHCGALAPDLHGLPAVPMAAPSLMAFGAYLVPPCAPCLNFERVSRCCLWG